MDPATRKSMTEQVKQMSYEELVAYRANKLDESVPAILADKEFERRARLEQHQLDLNLLAQQVRWMKFTAILGSTTTLIGTIVGAILGSLL